KGPQAALRHARCGSEYRAPVPHIRPPLLFPQIDRSEPQPAQILQQRAELIRMFLLNSCVSTPE
ncbi:MAG: hypothetical protein LBT80_08450, partial [Lactobacillaceae bacterium]|nr:hypothetical protein [Lactobacillaceae bacterium]